MKLIISILLFLLANTIVAQYEIYSTGSFGELLECQTTNCSSINHGTFYGFLDIAITPSGTLYGTADSLYLIDPVNSSITNIGDIRTNSGISVIGVGLVALNDDYLIGDHGDTLVKISVSTGIAEKIGYIGHYCGGDFAFYDNKLYMADEVNQLIEIGLDPLTQSVTYVNNIGVMGTDYGAVYALFTTFISCGTNEKGLFAIDYDKVYQIDPSNASAVSRCSLGIHESFGGASLYDFDIEYEIPIVPNVFTPNRDGINDFFELNFSYQSVVIFNRWGNKVYESKDNSHNWDGKTTAGVDVPAGTYYYIIHRDDCGQSIMDKGFLTLIR